MVDSCLMRRQPANNGNKALDTAISKSRTDSAPPSKLVYDAATTGSRPREREKRGLRLANRVNHLSKAGGEEAGVPRFLGVWRLLIGRGRT